MVTEQNNYQSRVKIFITENEKENKEYNETVSNTDEQREFNAERLG